MPSTTQPRAWFRLRPARLAARPHPVLHSYFEDRCTHLAAMVAYYALLSLVPFLFLLLSLTGAFGRASEGSFLVRELENVLPGQSVADLVDLVESIRRNATSYGAIGLFGLVWSSLGFLSSLESALNIIYDVPNRPFLRQKLLMTMLVLLGLTALFSSLVLTTAIWTWVELHRTGILGIVHIEVVLSVLFSGAVSFAFLLAVYRLVPNVAVTTREVLPGAVFGTIAFQASFQALPVYLHFSATQPALKAFGGIVVSLIWLFLMANVILLGAEINRWHGLPPVDPVAPAA